MNAREVYAVFVAGGSGSRMGTDIPKQFLDLGGIPVLQRSIERFLEAEASAHVIVVLPAHHIQTWREMCLQHAVSFPQVLVKGGMTRFHSVQAALAKVPEGAIVAVHDGVRPLVTPDLIRRMLDVMNGSTTGLPGLCVRSAAESVDGMKLNDPAEAGVVALIPVVPVTDTLRSTMPGAPAPDRSTLVAVQTPQMFLSEDLKRAYAQPYDTSFTDDASVAERAGIPVSTLPGEKFNLKITTPEDLTLARLLLSHA